MPRLSWRHALLVAGISAIPVAWLASGCAGPLPARSPAKPAPPLAAAASAPAAPPSSASAAASAASAPPPLAVTGGLDPALVAPVLEDARLAAVRADVDHEAYAKAAAELTSEIGAPSLSAEERAAWSYELGRIRALGGDPLGAARAYDDASAVSWPLADYARFAAAELLEQAGQHDAALQRARAVPKGLGIDRDLELVIADALAGEGDVDGAAAIWRAYLAKGHPPQWVSIALRFATALLAHPSVAHAEEAVAIARRVMYESPGGQGAGEAKDLEQQALGTIPFARRKRFLHPDAKELVARARGLLGAFRYKEALAAVSTVERKRGGKPGDLACESWMARGEALSRLRKKADAAEAFGEATLRCKGRARRADAMYDAARASAQAGRTAEAAQRYAELEKAFPKSRLADDARLRGARAWRELGDEARFTTMLSAMPDDYPDGDLVDDGLFELALAHIEKRDWAGAIAPLERGAAHAGKERAFWAAGRFPYYLGRAKLETGAVDEGIAKLVSVVRDYPLTFYMALAYARLAERDEALAKKTVAEAVAREPPGPFVIPKSSALEAPAFVRATWLARLGEPKLARAELGTLGVGSRGAPPELVWASAFLLARAGAAKESHVLLRAPTSSRAVGSELASFRDHWPAGAWRAPWEVAYPRPFADLVATESKRQGIPAALAYGIMREESAFDPHVASPAHAFGLMQLIVPTAKKVAKPLGLPGDEDALRQPEVNVALGCRYLSLLRGEFPDDPLLAIPSYNAGSGAPKRWLAERPTQDFDVWVERIPYDETRLYTKHVLSSMGAYGFLYAPDQPNEAWRTPREASPSAKAAAAVASNPATP